MDMFFVKNTVVILCLLFDVLSYDYKLCIYYVNVFDGLICIYVICCALENMAA